MKLSRFNEGQIIGMLKEHEADLGTAHLCRKHGVNSATIYKWKAKYLWAGGLRCLSAEGGRGRELRLTKLLAEAMLDNAILKDVAANKG